MRRRDVCFLALSGTLVLDTIGSVTEVGGQALTWLVALCALFLLPYALIVAELGSSFPHEGGPYVWVRLAFGRPAGALCALLYWIANPIWLGGTLSIVTVTVIESFFVGLGSGRYVVALLFIWLTVAAALVDLRGVRVVAALGALLRLALLALLTVSIVVYAAANGVHGISGGSLEPTGNALVVAVPLLIFGFLGLELPSALGAELDDPTRDVPAGAFVASLVTALGYIVPLAALLFVLPLEQRSSIGGFIDAIRSVFTVYGGHVDTQGVPQLRGAGSVLADAAAIAFIGALLTGGAAWLIGANRVQASAARDGAAPHVLARRSARLGSPIVLGIVSGVVATIVMTLSYELASGRFARYFTAMLGLGISTVLMSYLLVFPSLLRLRRTRPDVPRPFAVPGGSAGAWACTILTTAIALFATIELVYPGLGLAHPDALLPSAFDGLRRRYEQAMALPLAGLVVLAALSLASGRRRSASDA